MSDRQDTSSTPDAEVAQSGSPRPLHVPNGEIRLTVAGKELQVPWDHLLDPREWFARPKN